MKRRINIQCYKHSNASIVWDVGLLPSTKCELIWLRVKQFHHYGLQSNNYINNLKITIWFFFQYMKNYLISLHGFINILHNENLNLSYLPFSFSLYSPNKSHLFFLPFFLLPLPKSFQKFNLPHFILLLNHLFLLFFFFLLNLPYFFPSTSQSFFGHVHLCRPYISQQHHYFFKFHVIDLKF